MQIYDLSQIEFNGVSLFATTVSDNSGGNAKIGGLTTDNTLSVFASADGSSGPTVSINKALLLSALTIDKTRAQLGVGQEYQDKGTGTVDSFAAADISEVINLTDVSVAVFTQAIENIATLRADNGGSMSRLRHAAEDVALQKTNMIAANGRIKDVDIATESTNLAKYQVLVQASAAMLAQANTNTDVALMLLR